MEKMEPSHFVAFIGALFVMYEPVKKLSRVHNTIQQALASGERIFEILDAKTTVMEAPRPEILTRNIQEVVFEHVYFNYGDTPILKDIDIHVKRGEILAIVGSSGSGKTTLVNLIPRFYDPLRGRVLINGISVSEYSFTSLRDQIGIVWQETFLFNSTIRENISYGKSSASFEEIKRAAEAAYADDFIRLLPNGYDTVVGERGAALSGGERQRIAIARALLKDPPILILDEATSQLDTESEREVQKALDRLMEGRTVFVIAHRLSTVQRADRIIVLEEGQIVQDGKHDSLVSKSGRYKELYELQFSV
jgi:subfamily B ATP-binding cassette protein MsbA